MAGFANYFVLANSNGASSALWCARYVCLLCVCCVGGWVGGGGADVREEKESERARESERERQRERQREFPPSFELIFPPGPLN